MPKHRRPSDMPAAPPLKLVYIVGTGRIGSTLCGRLLAEYPDTIFLGETRYLWERGMLLGWPCSCGRQIGDCEFWRPVLHSAGINWDRERLVELIDCRRQTTRLRHFPLMWSRATRARLRRKAGPMLSAFKRVFHAAREVSGASVLVDSSKDPAFLLWLNSICSLQVFGLHLVRSPQAVAHSYSKRKLGMGPNQNQPMARTSLLKSSASWAAMNLAAESTRTSLQTRYRLQHYRSLAADPSRTVRRIRRWIGLSEPPSDAPSINEQVTFSPHHSIAGNVDRFELGPIDIRPDESWRHDMAGWRRLVVGVLTAPLAARYGFLSDPLLRD